MCSILTVQVAGGPLAVLMCVCVRVCMGVCVYVCIYIHECMAMHACVSECMSCVLYA